MRISPALISAALFCAVAFSARGEGALTSSATRSAQSEAPPIAFSPGEQSTFKVRYLGLPAGTTQITVGSQTEQWGVDVWPIVALAKTENVFAMFPVKDRFVTYWDPQARRCIGSDLMAEENKKRRRERVKLDQESHKAEVTKQDEGGPERQNIHDVEPGTMDMASAIFALRNEPLAVGKTFELPVFTGAKSFVLRARVIRTETLDTDMGPKNVYAVEVTTDFTGKVKAQRDLRAYFTLDPNHVLVRVEAELALGRVQANLIDYRQGRSLASLTPKP